MNSARQTMRILWTNRMLARLLLGSLAIVMLLLAPIAYLIVEYDISVEFLTLPVACVVIALAFVYGGIRSAINHPAFDIRYRLWLDSTPWTSSQALPKGPIHPLWPDFILVFGITLANSALALTIEPPMWPFVVGPAVAFAASLTVVWTLANAATGQTAFVYAVLAMPVVFGLLSWPAISFLIVPFATALIAWVGVRRSLITFPWDELRLDFVKSGIRSEDSSVVGWPYRELLSDFGDCRTTWDKALLQGSLLGAWVWLLFSSDRHSGADDVQGMMLIVAIAAFLGALWRLAMYAPVMCSAFCAGQRIAKRKWLIWQHDQMFLAPLLMIVAGWSLPWLLVNLLAMSAPTACALAAAVVFTIGRAMGPSRGKLQLTGVHSLSGLLPPSKQKEFVTTRGTNG